MPIYEYTCSKCEKLSDVLQKLNEPAPATCPTCGAEGTLSRVVSRTSFVLKGGGWGADLYASKKPPDAPASPAAEGAKSQPKDAAPASSEAPAASGGGTGSTTTATPASAPATSAPPKGEGQ
jgi:putative FmdB family regulatory protein